MAKKLKLNPWLTIWVSPRKTIREIIAYNPKHMVLALAILVGIVNFLSVAAEGSVGDYIRLPMLIAVSIIIGPIAGIINIYVMSWLLRWTGKWIGGKASSENIRTASAWSIGVPSASLLFLTAIEILIFGNELFTTYTPNIDESLTLQLALVIFILLELAISVWSFVLYCKTIGEVQGFSAWKGLLNILIPLFIIIIIVLFIIALATLGRYSSLP